ncbi:MAG: A/G-specific adenine glycosylase [Verrucomicrobia bacterium]|nr:A/G-specific adenine glycosylase [Verrucomicrobiota bacterium]
MTPAEFSRCLLEWYRRTHRRLPWRETRDPYAILVSETMLQQTQVKTVLPYFQRWLARYPTVKSLAAAPDADVLKAWEGLGYYRRARLLHAAAKCIVTEFNGEFPKSTEDISSLPGVGPYTLGAVASIAFNLAMPVVDGNVMRVLTRWFGIRENATRAETRKQLWDLAQSLIPEGCAGDFNQALMELGATVCVPHRPFCLLCPVRTGCWAFAHNAQEELPRVAPRPATVKEFEYAGLVLRSGYVLLCQRKGGQRMERLWQFPSVTLKKPVEQWDKRWKETFGAFKTSERLATLNYSVTNHRIRLEFFAMRDFTRRKARGTEWMSFASVRDLAFTAAHRKLADRFVEKPPAAAEDQAKDG